jgi:hypothetical protein
MVRAISRSIQAARAVRNCGFGGYFVRSNLSLNADVPSGRAFVEAMADFGKRSWPTRVGHGLGAGPNSVENCRGGSRPVVVNRSNPRRIT